jgi:hypothetical protein
MGRPSAVRPIGLGFLGPGHFNEKGPVYRYRISLDSLGFSRPKRDLSMGYAGFSLADFYSSLFPHAFRSAGRMEM